MTTEREQRKIDKEWESKYEDLIKQTNEHYWNDLEYRTIVTVSKSEEDRILADELYELRALKERFRNKI